MNIEWINHAGFIVEHDDIVLACDPWIEGKVFNNGWSLLSESKFTYEDFDKVTHIWFSHEHPDHFNPPNIKKIDKKIRKKITVIYQKTEDRKIIEFMSNLNFKEVIELPPSKWYNLSDDFKVLNQNDRAGDSWLAIKGADNTILNMNDVITYGTKKELSIIKNLVGEVDLLLTQFSYASWAGNKNDKAYREKLCAKKKDAMLMQCEVFEPKFLIPFASFVWFCREGNYYTNEDSNKIEDIMDFIQTKINVTPVLLYPGDKWKLGEHNDNTKALESYVLDRKNNVNKDNLVYPELIPFEELKKLAIDFGKRQRKFHSKIMLAIKLRKPAKVFIADHNKAVLFNLDGLKEINESSVQCDIIIKSEHLAYALKFNWGGDTLTVNGCFSVPNKVTLNRFIDYFYFSKQMNLGKPYTAISAVNNITRKLLK